jgi:hypothetical protein
LKPLPNEVLAIIIKINLTTNYQLLLNCNKVHRAMGDTKRKPQKERCHDIALGSGILIFQDLKHQLLVSLVLVVDGRFFLECSNMVPVMLLVFLS